jgi:chromosome partitioning protein
VRLSEAPSHGKTIFEYDGSSRAAAAYAEVAAEIVNTEKQVDQVRHGGAL